MIGGCTQHLMQLNSWLVQLWEPPLAVFTPRSQFELVSPLSHLDTRKYRGVKAMIPARPAQCNVLLPKLKALHHITYISATHSKGGNAQYSIHLNPAITFAGRAYKCRSDKSPSMPPTLSSSALGRREGDHIHTMLPSSTSRYHILR